MKPQLAGYCLPQPETSRHPPLIAFAAGAELISATVATDPIHRRRFLTLLCGHQEISIFLATIDQVLVTYPEFDETLAILSLVFIQSNPP